MGISLCDLLEFNIDLGSCFSLLITVFYLQHKPQVKNVNHIGQNVRRAPSPLRPRPPSVVAAEKLAAKKLEEEKRYQRGKVPK